jgi:hypothetical protein
MWWSRKAKPEFDAVAHLRGTLAQTTAILEAEQAGKRAWRILVVNGMLAEEFRHPARRRYRFSVTELAQLSGIPERQMGAGMSLQECEQC